jgi:hypothetical protein
LQQIRADRGEEADENFNELEMSPRLMNPKSYASLFKAT